MQANAPSDLAEVFDQNAQACKSVNNSERTRREQVTEMILERTEGSAARITP
jgi:hypothetical protein